MMRMLELFMILIILKMKKDLSYLRFSYKLNLVMVSHCYQFSKNTIRIISARKATKSESKRYEAFL